MRGRFWWMTWALGTLACGSGSGSGAVDDSTCEAICEATDGITSECAAIVDNAGKTSFGLRISQISFTRPGSLSATGNGLGAILANAANPALPECHLNGGGGLSWLLQFDMAAGTWTSGGGGNVSDPTGGYCFEGAPATGTATREADGSLYMSGSANVLLPVYAAGSLAFSLPLSGISFREINLSADQNCIGTLQSAGLDPAAGCVPEPDELYAPGGMLDGFISLEDADAIIIPDLQKSLCSLLTGSGDGGTPEKCERSMFGSIATGGDWCAMMNSPAGNGCADAIGVTVQFAASAVEIQGTCP